MEVFLHNLFLKYATETEGNKCKAAFYTYKQIGMRSLEPFWPCTILAKNLGDVLARGLSIGPCFSMHYQVMEHAGSLESTKEA